MNHRPAALVLLAALTLALPRQHRASLPLFARSRGRALLADHFGCPILHPERLRPDGCRNLAAYTRDNGILRTYLRLNDE